MKGISHSRKTLRYLKCSGNDLCDDKTLQFANRLTLLEELKCSSCGLGGTLQPLENLIYLKYLKCDDNDIYGTLSCLRQFTRLECINISYTNIEGSFVGLENCSDLWYVFSDNTDMNSIKGLPHHSLYMTNLNEDTCPELEDSLGEYEDAIEHSGTKKFTKLRKNSKKESVSYIYWLNDNDLMSFYLLF